MTSSSHNSTSIYGLSEAINTTGLKNNFIALLGGGNNFINL